MFRCHGPAWVLLPLCAAAAHAQSPSIPAPPEAELAPVVVTSRKNPDQSTLTQPDLPTARARI